MQENKEETKTLQPELSLTPDLIGPQLDLAIIDESRPEYYVIIHVQRIKLKLGSHPDGKYKFEFDKSKKG